MTFNEAVVQQPKTTAKSSSEVRHLTYNELDILHCLRGFCAFYVVIFHAKYTLWSGGRQYLEVHPRATWTPLDYFAFGMDMLSSAGFEMVIFFFVLSGFFIRYAQLKKHRAPLDFYLNRVLRIYPPYIVSVVLAAGVLTFIALQVPSILQAGSGRELNESLPQAWQELRNFNLLGAVRVLSFMKLKDFFIGYNHVYWSLLPEALFYLFVPLAFWRIRAYYGISILCWVVSMATQHLKLDPTPIGVYWLTYNCYFAVGVALYDLVIKTNWLDRFRRMPQWVAAILSLVLFLALIPLAILKLKVVSGIVATVLAIFWVSYLLAGKVSRQNPAVRLMHWVGVFSFSLYLYHTPLLLLCYGLLARLTGETVFYARYYWLALPLVTLVCYGLYWVTERASVNYFRKV